MASPLEDDVSALMSNVSDKMELIDIAGLRTAEEQDGSECAPAESGRPQCAQLCTAPEVAGEAGGAGALNLSMP
jgi:hypothetical protein